MLEQLYLQAEQESSKTFSDIIRLLFLTNGGALVALLAFVGGLAQKPVVIPHQIIGGMTAFFWGILLTVGVALSSFILNDMRIDERMVALSQGRLPPLKIRVLSWRFCLAASIYIPLIATGVGFVMTSNGMYELALTLANTAIIDIMEQSVTSQP